MDEQASIDMLLEFIGDRNGDRDRATRVLRRHNGNLEAAVDEMVGNQDYHNERRPAGNTEIAGKGALNVPRNTPERDTLPPYYAQGKNVSTSALSQPQVVSVDTEVIDLTRDEDDPDLKKAIELSLASQQVDNAVNQNFRPSDRPADPSWAMVPTSATAVTNSNELQLMQAIEASLSTHSANEKYDELQGEQLIRQDSRPVALRTRDPNTYFAGPVLQALFYVPQVREKVARWRPVPDMRTYRPDPGSQENTTWNLMALFARMDLTVQSALNLDDVLPGFNIKKPTTSDNPGDLSNELYSTLAYAADRQLSPDSGIADTKWHRLFHLRYANTASEPNNSPLNRRSDTACVRVDIRNDNEMNDLLSCLSQQLFLHETDDTSNHLSLFEPSDVVAFQLVRHNVPTVQTQAESTKRVPFQFPAYVYLDQFLRENAEVANRKRGTQRKMAEDIEAMLQRRVKLLYHEGKDVQNDLASALYYYENIANKDGPIRSAQIRDVTLKLRKILARVQNGVQALESRIDSLRQEFATVFDDPSLQKFRYDLRAVLMHDGLYGRQHIYSYVKHNGKWWKIVDYTVTEVVEETVLSDATGLHLDAGPYMLIYSRAVQDPHDFCSYWPTALKESAKVDNDTFLSTLPPLAVDSVRQQHAARLSVSTGRRSSVADNRMEGTQSRLKGHPPQARAMSDDSGGKSRGGKGKEAKDVS